MRKLFALALVTGVLAFCGVSSATEKPSVAELVRNAQWVAVGKVSEVQHLDDGGQRITVNVSKYLKGLNALTKQITFLFYIRGVEGQGFALNYDEIKASGEEYFFTFLPVADDAAHMATFHLELSDAWFGAEKLTPKILREAETAIREQFEQKK